MQGCNSARMQRCKDWENTDTVLIGLRKAMKNKDDAARRAIEQITNTIDSLRVSSGLSISALAKEADLSENTLKYIFKKEGFPSLPVLIRLCGVFEIPLWRFFLIADGKGRYEHQKFNEMIELFENLDPVYRDLLLYIAGKLPR